SFIFREQGCLFASRIRCLVHLFCFFRTCIRRLRHRIDDRRYTAAWRPVQFSAAARVMILFPEFSCLCVFLLHLADRTFLRPSGHEIKYTAYIKYEEKYNTQNCRQDSQTKADDESRMIQTDK